MIIYDKDQGFEKFKLEFQSLPLAIGSTLSSHKINWQALEMIDVGPRSSVTHKFLGAVRTRPERNVYTIGLVWLDNKGQYKEDIIEFDLMENTHQVFYRGRYERYRSEYRGHHYGDKSYLLQ